MNARVPMPAMLPEEREAVARIAGDVCGDFDPVEADAAWDRLKVNLQAQADQAARREMVEVPNYIRRFGGSL